MARRENPGKPSAKTGNSLEDFLAASEGHVEITGDDTGRSAAIQEILTAIRARGDRAIVMDPDGALEKNFYDPLRGDVVLKAQDREPVSINNWVEQGRAGKEPEEGGFLFLHYKRNDLDARQSIVPAWLEQGIRTAMNKEPNKSQRLWIIAGDVDAIEKINLLREVPARPRKFGVRLAIASDPKNKNTRNTVIFSVREDTAKYAAALIGEATVLHSPGHDRDHPKTTQGRPRPNWAYIENLSDGTGLLRTSADPFWRIATVENRTSEVTAERDVSRRSASLRQRVVDDHYKGRPGIANPSTATSKDKASEKDTNAKNKPTRDDDGHDIH